MLRWAQHDNEGGGAEAADWLGRWREDGGYGPGLPGCRRFTQGIVLSGAFVQVVLCDLEQYGRIEGDKSQGNNHGQDWGKGLIRSYVVTIQPS